MQVKDTIRDIVKEYFNVDDNEVIPADSLLFLEIAYVIEAKTGVEIGTRFELDTINKLNKYVETHGA